MKLITLVIEGAVYTKADIRHQAAVIKQLPSELRKIDVIERGYEFTQVCSELALLAESLDAYARLRRDNCADRELTRHDDECITSLDQAYKYVMRMRDRINDSIRQQVQPFYLVRRDIINTANRVLIGINAIARKQKAAS